MQKNIDRRCEPLCFPKLSSVVARSRNPEGFSLLPKLLSQFLSAFNVFRQRTTPCLSTNMRPSGVFWQAAPLAVDSSTNKGRLALARRSLLSVPQGLVNFGQRLELVVRRGAR